MSRYNPFDIESKWQKKWAESSAFSAKMDPSKPKYYVLEMLPYPSGKLHMGHVRNYTLGDVLARYKRAQGFNVLHPMGWDAFGLPAENAALKNGSHPAEWTFGNIAYMKKSMESFGWSYDWNREVASCHPSYYAQQQSLFIDFYSKGLIYQKEALVNWDPVEHTVLANEQVVDGKGWRSGAPVERRSMRQWFMGITKYADELLNDLEQLQGWPDRVRIMQENWIGRSEGLTFAFDVNETDDKLEVYTTRPDTIMGVTFVSVAPEHPLAKKASESDSQAVKFIEECQALGTAEEIIEKAEKKGYKTNYTVKHPITGEALPVYIANFVLMSYGTGAVMAVPAHDERDFAFATKYDLPIKYVIDAPEMPENEVYTGEGSLVNSGEWDGLDNVSAKSAVIQKMENMGLGQRTVNYRLRDWGMSRQRYWGAPIPFIHCSECGTVPVPKDQLPVELPKDVTFDTPGNPLDRHPTWKHTSCPCCGKDAVRETDTMDTFMDSSWYFMRYCSPRADTPLDEEVGYWMPVDQYIGGIEHAVLHLLYARFFTKGLRDCGYVTFDEPFKALLCQGMLVGHSYKDAKGDYINPEDIRFEGDKAFHAETGEQLNVLPVEKISKSKNNGIEPAILLDRYGADTLRIFMMFTAPPERDLEWSDSGVDGAWRFLGRVWNLVQQASDVDWLSAPLSMDMLESKDSRDIKRQIHKTIRRVTQDIERFQYNTMVAACMELSNALGSMELNNAEASALYAEGVNTLIRLLNPITPHITEQLWEDMGQTTSLCSMVWPQYDEDAAKDDEITLVVQMNGKLRERLNVAPNLPNEEAEKLALDAIQPHLGDLTVRKCIVVPNRLVNIVAN